MIDLAALAAAVAKAAQTFDTHEADLNAADSKLGDGDTGSMLKRLSAGLAATEVSNAASLGDAFRALAMAASASTGSSLGTLVMTALMSFAKATAGKPAIAAADLPPLLDAAIESVLKRGGAHPGDKTFVDSLIAISAALATAPDPASARSAAHAALDQFRDLPNRLGRAGRYGDGSRGLDDPGMLAVALFCDAL
jgi:dihydroxyacetone kinase